MSAEPPILELPVSIRREEVLCFLGYPEGRDPPPRVEAVLGPVLDEARRLVRARGTWRSLPVGRAAEVGLEPVEAAVLVLGLATAGGPIEERIGRHLEHGDTLRALLLEAAGSAAAEEAADRIGAAVASEGATRDVRGGAVYDADAVSPVPPVPHVLPDAPVPAVSCRISPGYGRWSLLSQRALFDLLPHERVGVSLLPSMLMVPRKSVSFAMWLGADARPIEGLSGCARCRLEHCRYRKTPPQELPG